METVESRNVLLTEPLSLSSMVMKKKMFGRVALNPVQCEAQKYD